MKEYKEKVDDSVRRMFVRGLHRQQLDVIEGTTLEFATAHPEKVVHGQVNLDDFIDWLGVHKEPTCYSREELQEILKEYLDKAPALKTKEEVKEEFKEKNKYLEGLAPYVGNQLCEELDLTPAPQREFIEYIFERKIYNQRDVQPFEQQQSKEYILWLTQYKMNQKNRKNGNPAPSIDYSGYGCWRYNPIVFIKQGGKNKHHLILKDDDGASIDYIEDLHLHQKDGDFAILSPVTYVGRNNTADNARYLYAFAFDLDGVGIRQLKGMEKCIFDLHTFPMPNIIVNSGHGLHLYFLLQHPVPLFPKNHEILNKLKKGLTDKIWNDLTSDIMDLQYQGVLQSFRMPDTRTKFGGNIQAFYSRKAPMYTLAELNSYVVASKRLTNEELAKLGDDIKYNSATGCTLAAAQEKWPEWYVERVIKKLPPSGKWHVKRDVYDWWLNRLKDTKDEVKLHHRYWCILTLVVLAVKCDIPEDEVREDGYSLVEKFDRLSETEDNRFTKGDVDDAMMAYAYKYNQWPISEIERTTTIQIKRNRRNYREQKDHLKRARYSRDLDHVNWRDGNGRKKGSTVSSEDSRCAQIVKKWRDDNPSCQNKSECARATGLTRPTVRKWWNEESLEEPE